MKKWVVENIDSEKISLEDKLNQLQKEGKSIKQIIYLDEIIDSGLLYQIIYTEEDIMEVDK